MKTMKFTILLLWFLTPNCFSQSARSLTDGTGIIEPTTVSKFDIFPNPVKSDLVIKYSQNLVPDHSTIQIYNLTGQVLLEKSIENSREKIDCSSIPQGIYFVKIMAGETVMTKKMIKE
jgi:hypothetical protein